jgi:diadenosine tetraphosphatase ApaH/serine/threonine PP2A family protein phosphatase
VHGSPRKINEYLYEDRPDSSLERLMDQAGVDVLVCGHTHIPYHRVLPSGRHVINAGSVGKPKDHDPRACYIILEVEGRELNVRFIRVPYDIEQAAAAIESSEMPDEYAEMLRAFTPSAQAICAPTIWTRTGTGINNTRKSARLSSASRSSPLISTGSKGICTTGTGKRSRSRPGISLAWHGESGRMGWWPARVV